MERGRRGLLQGRASLLLAVLTVALTWVLWVQAAGGPAPMFAEGPPGIGAPGVVAVVALALQAAGLAWMWRIHRARLEAARDALHRYRASRPGAIRGRRRGLAASLVTIFVGAAWLISTPDLGPSVEGPVATLAANGQLLTLIVGGVGTVLGVLWVRRIAADDDEADARVWRYRDLD